MSKSYRQILSAREEIAKLSSELLRYICLLEDLSSERNIRTVKKWGVGCFSRKT